MVLVALARVDDFLFGDAYRWLFSSMHIYDIFANVEELVDPMTLGWKFVSLDVSRTVYMKVV